MKIINVHLESIVYKTMCKPSGATKTYTGTVSVALN